MEGLSEKEIKGRLQELCVTLSTGKEKEIEQAAYIYVSSCCWFEMCSATI